MTTRRRAPGVLAAVRRELRKLPDTLRDAPEAAAAIEMARTIDQGMHQVTCSRELRILLATLRAQALEASAQLVREEHKPVKSEEGAGLADLSARIAARRGTASG